MEIGHYQETDPYLERHNDLLMKSSVFAVIFYTLLLGCSSPSKDVGRRQPNPPIVNIAVNLGWNNFRDLQTLYDGLASMGVTCGMRAMSLNAAPIVVERHDFDRAKAIATDLIVRERLTVRVFKSADFESSPTNGLLEVWERGRKVREEGYKLYMSPYTGPMQ